MQKVDIAVAIAAPSMPSRGIKMILSAMLSKVAPTVLTRINRLLPIASNVAPLGKVNIPIANPIDKTIKALSAELYFIPNVELRTIPGNKIKTTVKGNTAAESHLARVFEVVFISPVVFCPYKRDATGI